MLSSPCLSATLSTANPLPLTSKFGWYTSNQRPSIPTPQTNVPIYQRSITPTDIYMTSVVHIDLPPIFTFRNFWGYLHTRKRELGSKYYPKRVLQLQIRKYKYTSANCHSFISIGGGGNLCGKAMYYLSRWQAEPPVYWKWRGLFMNGAHMH